MLHLLLNVVGQPGKQGDDDQVHYGDDQPHLEALEVLGDQVGTSLRQVHDPDGGKDGSVLKSDDELVDQGWNHQLEALRGNNLPQGFVVRQTQGPGRFPLTHVN